jgi:energy-coupling factor transport system ATP-binding protein
VESAARSGRTIVASSHDMRFVAESFERIVVLRQGTIVADGPPDAVFAPAGWELLSSTHLEAPPAARVGRAFGLGSTPTEESLVLALKAQPA